MQMHQKTYPKTPFRVEAELLFLVSRLPCNAPVPTHRALAGTQEGGGARSSVPPATCEDPSPPVASGRAPFRGHARPSPRADPGALDSRPGSRCPARGSCC